MREIKFRAWDKHYKRFRDIVLSSPISALNNNEIDERFELTQYTGLKDKNRKEIYEGDILKTYEGNLMRVIWNNNGFKLMFKFKRTYQGEEYFETRKDISLKGSDDKRFGCEVVGNIYENPTLLKY
jgi:uncharacterized phage protein (TIGR01671 family)|nr:MAG TPA: YopX protein [Caudoviricetes sp.]